VPEREADIAMAGYRDSRRPSARIAVASGRLGEAVQEIGRRFDEINARSARFAKVGGNRN
jgi:hypothetical protein